MEQVFWKNRNREGVPKGLLSCFLALSTFPIALCLLLLDFLCCSRFQIHNVRSLDKIFFFFLLFRWYYNLSSSLPLERRASTLQLLRFL
jgi:hypothetical protein